MIARRTWHVGLYDDVGSITELAASLVCPITKEVFCVPVIARDGFTYEKSAMDSWHQSTARIDALRSPMTNLPMRRGYVISITMFKIAIAALKLGLLECMDTSALQRFLAIPSRAVTRQQFRTAREDLAGSLVCPVGKCVVAEPCAMEDGYIYENHSIVNTHSFVCYKKGLPFHSPITKQPMNRSSTAAYAFSNVARAALKLGLLDGKAANRLKWKVVCDC